MKEDHEQYRVLAGIGFALLSTLIWSGNFIIARDAVQTIPPVSLAFYRWLTATMILAPFAIRKLVSEWMLIRTHLLLLFLSAITGISLFNTFVYIAGHYSTAINLAIIGTTSAPILATILAALFLKEKITLLRAAGMALCIGGILVLLSKGSWSKLASFQFNTGDGWILLAAFCFAIYTISVKRKPASISPQSFLLFVFGLGTILLIPFFLHERAIGPAISWNLHSFTLIMYLGLGASVIAFLCWNAAIARLGAARTSVFGNLIPIFSSMEAVLLLGEKISILHFISFILVMAGLFLANYQRSKPNY